ncbi:sigma-70 family RNA polymerase sigma factor [Streptomyces sp. NPDC006465]|uniref:sigma-70 family RNA polymerase sigma factor n=1 Tax=Streptomyces sp. NPDC006465 TaxID=3157174 RepID=UPI00339F91AB
MQVHCYRMLGSFEDAEDALQNTLLTAWQSLGGFEGRASLRTSLYRIATHRCLDERRAASRRPAKEWGVDVADEWPEPSRLGEVVWLQPFPGALLEGMADLPLGPEARYRQTESISLAFVTALQILPPRQLAVLILRDVLGFRASEVAGMLDSTVESVNSALKRARGGLRRRLLLTEVPLHSLGLVAFLNRDLLLGQWPVLRTLIGRPLRDAWEAAFPELAAARSVPAA